MTPDTNDLSVYFPAWFQGESGLMLPSSIGAPAGSNEVRIPSDLLPPPKPVALSRDSVSFMDQVSAYADEEAAGLPISSLDDVLALVTQIPFEAGMHMVASLAAKAWGLRGNQEAQLELAEQLVGPGPVLEHLRVFVHEDGRSASVFAEQHALMLERLLIEKAIPGLVTEPLTPPLPAIVVRTLFGCTSLAAVDDDLSTPPQTPEDLLPFFLQNGAYNNKAMPLLEIGRALELFTRIARQPELLPTLDKVCPLDDWMLDDYRFSVEDQLRIGFALSAMSNAWSQGRAAGEATYLAPDNVADLLVKLDLEDRRDDVLNLISADRSQYQKEFGEHEPTPARITWETRPLMRHPFLRCENGGLILLTPRAIQSWLTEGFHYRLLDAAQRRAALEGNTKLSNRYTAYVGQLLEVYALELMRSVYPGNRPVGGGRVYGEQPYGPNGEKKTSDVIVDLGSDLVMFEVSARRLRADTLLLAKPEDAFRDIDLMVIEKLKQLDKCITGLRSRRRNDRVRIPADNPDVDMNRVERIWPVLVTAGVVTHGEALWYYIRRRTLGLFDQAGVQPLTILDIEDYEALCGLIESGTNLSTILMAKTQPQYQDLELAVWLIHDPHGPRNSDHPQYVRDVWQRGIDGAIAGIDFTKGAPQDSA